MNSDHLALQIREKALELGFDQCGIVRAADLCGYADQLQARMESDPETRPFYEPLLKLAYPQQKHGWAKAVIVCVRHFGKYRIPGHLDRLIGKYYLCDYRRQPDSREYAAVAAFESFLADLGLQAVKDALGVTPARWAARRANLGVIRKNNLFYTGRGSWVWLETWLIDRELEYRAGAELPPPCPDNCRQCSAACPTGALAGPFQMKPDRCISRLTYQRNGLAPEPLRGPMGQWLYGCDLCQNACPMNQQTWEEEADFPGLAELAGLLSLENIAALEEQVFTEVIQPKFWYIGREGGRIWRCNALRAMANAYRPAYATYLKEACRDSDPDIRAMGSWACERVGL